MTNKAVQNIIFEIGLIEQKYSETTWYELGILCFIKDIANQVLFKENGVNTILESIDEEIGYLESSNRYTCEGLKEVKTLVQSYKA